MCASKSKNVELCVLCESGGAYDRRRPMAMDFVGRTRSRNILIILNSKKISIEASFFLFYVKVVLEQLKRVLEQLTLFQNNSVCSRTTANVLGQ